MCCHGYLNNPLGVLQDKVNMVTPKVLEYVCVCVCVCVMCEGTCMVWVY